MNKKYDALKLKNQLCFSLYASSKEMIKQYKPFLEPLDLTYTQYLAMMVIWEQREVSVKDLGECLFLDSGTLTPVLKKLEAKGYVTRERSKADERNLVIRSTSLGDKLKEKALKVPQRLEKYIPLSKEEEQELHRLLDKVLGMVEA